MRYTLPAALALALILSACDQQEPAAPVAFDLRATSSASCGLVQHMDEQVSSYFPLPERTAAQTTLASLAAACADGNAPAALVSAATLLGSIERLLDQTRGGDAGVGAALARGLLSCTRAPLCVAGTDLPDANLALRPAMADPRGMFAFRPGTSSAPAVARAGIPFLNNSLLWGVEVRQGSNWHQARRSKSAIALIYGWPTGTISPPPGVTDTYLGSGYELRHWPDTNGFEDGLVGVGVCGLTGVALPVPQDNALRVQRNSTLLENFPLRFCVGDGDPVKTRQHPSSASAAASASEASAASPATALASRFLPASLVTTNRSVVRSPVVGGSPLDFSTFVIVAARTDGRLKARWHVPVNPTVTTRMGVTVAAYSGGNAPMERVPVSIHLFTSTGVPVSDVLLNGTRAGETDETRGSVLLDGFTISEPGLYVLCAKVPDGGFAGFAYAEACSPAFNVKG